MLEYAVSLISGALVKLVDTLENKTDKRSKILSWVFAVVYGILIGFLIAKAPFSILFLGALFAQLVAGKIDTSAHETGFLIALISAFFFGIPPIDLGLFVFFVIFAVLDETEFFKGTLKSMHEYRLFLPLAAIIAVAFTGRLEYLLGIVTFDVGYLLSEKSVK